MRKRGASEYERQSVLFSIMIDETGSVIIHEVKTYAGMKIIIE